MGDLVHFPPDRARRVLARVADKTDDFERETARLKALLHETELRAMCMADTALAVEYARKAARLKRAIQAREEGGAA